MQQAFSLLVMLLSLSLSAHGQSITLYSEGYKPFQQPADQACHP